MAVILCFETDYGILELGCHRNLHVPYERSGLILCLKGAGSEDTDVACICRVWVTRPGISLPPAPEECRNVKAHLKVTYNTANRGSVSHICDLLEVLEVQ